MEDGSYWLTVAPVVEAGAVRLAVAFLTRLRAVGRSPQQSLPGRVRWSRLFPASGGTSSCTRCTVTAFLTGVLMVYTGR